MIDVLTALRQGHLARVLEWWPGVQPDLSFRGNELAGEAGEACNVIKKLERERLGRRGSRATVQDLADELADVVIVADMIACAAGFELGPAIVAKFNATSEKYGLATRIPLSGGCAVCDRGDYQLGHAHDCPKSAVNDSHSPDTSTHD